MNRYDIDQEEEQWATMEEYSNGEWVKHSDVLDLLDDLQKIRQGWEEGNYSEDGFINDILHALKEVTE